MNSYHKILSGVDRSSIDECDIPVPRRRSKNTLDTPKDAKVNLEQCGKDHLLSSEISEQSNHVKFYRAKSNSLPAIFSSHSFKIAMNTDFMPWQLKTIEDRCAEFSKCLNEKNAANSMQDIDVTVELKRRSSEPGDSRQFCRWLHKFGIWGKMVAVVILIFVTFLLVRMLLILYA